MSNVETLTPGTVLAELESKLTNATQLRDDTEAAILAISFAAHSGDAAAHKRLDALNQKAASAALEIRSLEAAVAEARKRVGYAAAVETDANERENARNALALLGDFERRGEQLDHAMGKVLSQYEELIRDFNALEKLGFPPNSKALIEINAKRAIQTKLMSVGLQSEFLPPNERHTFAEVIEGWAQAVRSRIEARLRRNPPTKEAA
jgi:hypothetical protein